MRKIIALVKNMIFGWKIMAAVKIVIDWIFLFGFSFIQYRVTSFPYLDCVWGWSLQNIKRLCWFCLHCFLDFGLIHHQDHLIYKIYPSNWAITTWLNLIPTCLTCIFLFSKKHHKKKVCTSFDCVLKSCMCVCTFFNVLFTCILGQVPLSCAVPIVIWQRPLI